MEDDTEDHVEDDTDNLSGDLVVKNVDLKDEELNNTDGVKGVDVKDVNLKIIEGGNIYDLDANNVDIHDPKTTVKVLSALAKARNLRTRGLKKDKIIELLENNP